MILELAHKFNFYDLAHSIVHNKEYRLNESNSKRLTFRLKYGLSVVKLLMIMSMIIFVIYSTSFVLIAYLDPNTDHSLILLVFWWTTDLICFYYLSALLVNSWFGIYFFSIYFVFRFKQIESFIDDFQKTGNYFHESFHPREDSCSLISNQWITSLFDFSSIGNPLLLKLIVRQHNIFCAAVQHLNDSSKYLSAIYYYFTIPIIDLLIILTTVQDLNLFSKVAVYFVILVALSLIGSLGLILCSMSKSVHSPYIKLNVALLKIKPGNLRIKWKVLGLVEKLAGPTIGLYCYDLFPFTTYKLYNFTANCVLNFILLMGLLK